VIEQDLRAYLLAKPAIAALVGDRMYPERLPQRAALPAITYQRVFGTSLFTHDGAAGLGRGRLQLDCWGSTYQQSAELAEAVRAELAGYLGPMGGTGSVAPRIGTVIDAPEPEIDRWRRIVDVPLWHSE
jgi:hypothetical protein